MKSSNVVHLGRGRILARYCGPMRRPAAREESCLLGGRSFRSGMKTVGAKRVPLRCSCCSKDSNVRGCK